MRIRRGLSTNEYTYLKLPSCRLADLIRVVLLHVRTYHSRSSRSGILTAKTAFNDFSHSAKVVYW